MTLTRITVKQIKGKMKVVKKQTGLADDNPVVYHGNEDLPIDGDIKPIARGFAAFKEYINRNGRPKAGDPKQLVTIRLPVSILATLRSTGRGWQTRASEYLVKGVRRGALSVS